jgi:hypothetical protein
MIDRYGRYNRNDGHIINMPDSIYKDLIELSKITGDSVEKILQRGIQLGMLESIVKLSNGYLLVRTESGHDPVIIK